MATATGALPPPLPDIFASRFFGKPKSAPLATRPCGISASRFLRPKRLSRFFNQAAKVRRRISRFITGTAALTPPMPDIFAPQFTSKPPPKPKTPLRGHWPRKPSGPKL